MREEVLLGTFAGLHVPLNLERPKPKTGEEELERAIRLLSPSSAGARGST